MEYIGIMNQYLFTVNEAANLLKLHPKTLRRKIQSGEIESTKVGKQYRLTRNQLEDFCGSPIGDSPDLGPVTRRKVLVSTVIDIHAISQEDSSRITNYLMASQKNEAVESNQSSSRIDSIYSPELGYLKILISGDSSVVRELMKIIEKLTSERT